MNINQSLNILKDRKTDILKIWNYNKQKAVQERHNSSTGNKCITWKKQYS